MSIPPPSFQHPGSPPEFPEVPDGITPAPRPQPAPQPDRRWPELGPWWGPFAAAAVAVTITIVSFGIIAAFVAAAGVEIDGDDLPTGVTLAGTVVQGMALIGCALLFAGIGGRRPRAADFGLRRARFWHSVGWAVLVMVGFYVFSFAWALIAGIEESDDLAVDLGAKDSTVNLIAVSLLVGLIAPIGEEFFFRGYMLGALANRWGLVIAIAVVGAVFGAFHVGGTPLHFIPPLMVLGGLLCVLFWRTRSLLPCIALHAVNNAVALAVTLDWEPWQVALGAVTAPVLAVLVVLPFCDERWTTPAPA